MKKYLVDMIRQQNERCKVEIGINDGDFYVWLLGADGEIKEDLFEYNPSEADLIEFLKTIITNGGEINE